MSTQIIEGGWCERTIVKRRSLGLPVVASAALINEVESWSRETCCTNTI